jgi:hypothetical protein|tara:strand:- start:66 stop:980 length:915 start_codon:yes stop_codon:yes gene_type:complete
MADRISRVLENSKETSSPFVGTKSVIGYPPSSNSMKDGDIVFAQSSNKQLALFKKYRGRVHKSYLSSDGNEYVDRDITIKNNLIVGGTADIDGNMQIDGSVTIGVDDTGYDVKFFGATSGKYVLWDESEDTLSVVGELGLSEGCHHIGNTGTKMNFGTNSINFYVNTNANARLTINSLGATFNQAADASQDFRIETANKQAAFFVDGGDDCVAINNTDATPTIDGDAVGQLVIVNGTKPSALTADQIYIGAENSAGTGTDTLSTLSLFLEEGIDATALDAVGTLSHRIPIWLNGTCYWLYLDPV